MRSGFEVYHKESKYIDHAEISRIDIPHSTEEGPISWTIEHPKIGYCCVVNFKAINC